MTNVRRFTTAFAVAGSVLGSAAWAGPPMMTEVNLSTARDLAMKGGSGAAQKSEALLRVVVDGLGVKTLSVRGGLTAHTLVLNPNALSEALLERVMLSQCKALPAAQAKWFKEHAHAKDFEWSPLVASWVSLHTGQKAEAVSALKGAVTSLLSAATLETVERAEQVVGCLRDAGEDVKDLERKVDAAEKTLPVQPPG